MPSSLRWRQAFSLIEMLVVVAIVAILAAMLLPTVRMIQDSARTLQCQSNLRATYLGYVSFAAENRGLLPRAVNDGQSRHVGSEPCAGTWMHHPREVMCPSVLRGAVINRRSDCGTVGERLVMPMNASCRQPCYQRPSYGINHLLWINSKRLDRPVGYWPVEPLPPSQALMVGDTYGWIMYDSPENVYCVYPHKGRSNAVAFDGRCAAFNLPQTLNYLVGRF